ncbi:hypothetical protein FQN52_000030 [Onygenales sp. PD_12]|nr:hypothetical protein FQN52_000030 [Onygenales sp. PD_12]
MASLFLTLDGQPIPETEALGYGGTGVVVLHQGAAIKLPLRHPLAPQGGLGTCEKRYEPNIDALHREQNVYCRLSPSVDTQLEGVVPYLALCPTATHLVHMENGDLCCYLENKNKNKNKPSLTLQLAWFRQMARALARIHDQRVLICDSYREEEFPPRSDTLFHHTV